MLLPAETSSDNDYEKMVKVSDELNELLFIANDVKKIENFSLFIARLVYVTRTICGDKNISKTIEEVSIKNNLVSSVNMLLKEVSSIFQGKTGISLGSIFGLIPEYPYRYIGDTPSEKLLTTSKISQMNELQILLDGEGIINTILFLKVLHNIKNN